MKTISLIFILALCGKSIAHETREKITCSDIKKVALGSVFVWFSTEKTEDVELKFHLATNKNPQIEQIGKPINSNQLDWSALQTASFNPSAKTIFIIHGFKSGGTKSWVVNLKNALLQAREANIILVDWSEASNQKNYVNAARNTELATNRIFQFLQQLRAQVDQMETTSKSNDWTRLYFIGHSLGAQVSGQTAHLLKRDDFWKVERITALDPAKPCFMNVDLSLRVGKEDADFVDVIHTQSGLGGNADALGLRLSIGHIDFYVNTGIEQPECNKKMSPVWDTMICSHKLAYKYFTESVENSVNGGCRFVGYSWDGTSQSAQAVFNYVKNGSNCDDCPELGINADKSNKRGNFLVITSSKEPHCIKPNEFDDKDTQGVIKVINKLKGAKPLTGSAAQETDILTNPGVCPILPSESHSTLYSGIRTTETKNTCVNTEVSQCQKS